MKKVKYFHTNIKSMATCFKKTIVLDLPVTTETDLVH